MNATADLPPLGEASEGEASSVRPLPRLADISLFAFHPRDA